MNTVEQKLRRGFGLVERASNDSDLLGVGLLSIHSALEDYLRGVLSNHAEVSAADRQRLIRREVGWRGLVELAQRHLGVAEDQRRVILEADEVRRSFIHGNPFRWRVGDVIRYGRFVEALCGEDGLFEEVLLERRAERPSRPMPAAPPPQPQEQSRWPLYLLRLAIMLAVLGTIVIGLLAGYQWLDRTFLRELEPATSAAPTVNAGPTLAPTATARRARIVNLGGGPGWLHDTASFASPTLPIRLAEGDVVVLMDDPLVEAEGTTWQRVSVSGYQGWSPVNNLQVDQ